LAAALAELPNKQATHCHFIDRPRQYAADLPYSKKVASQAIEVRGALWEIN
jgi:hypothetical protein